MESQDLVNALREHAEWAERNQWKTPITLCDDLAEAADRLENQNAHIAALQQEIEKLRWQMGEPKDPEKMVAIVEQRAAEHPTKTRQSVFLELFPESTLAKDGVLTICPNAFSPVYKDERGRCKLPYAECDNCRRKFWLAEVEDA